MARRPKSNDLTQLSFDTDSLSQESSVNNTDNVKNENKPPKNRTKRNQDKIKSFSGMQELRVPRDEDNNSTLIDGTNIDLTHDSSGTGTGKTSSHTNGVFDDICISNKNKKDDIEKWGETFITSIYATHTVKQTVDTTKDNQVLAGIKNNFKKTGIATPALQLPSNETLLMAWTSLASVINISQIGNNNDVFSIDRISVVEHIVKQKILDISTAKFVARKEEKSNKKKINKKEFKLGEFLSVIKTLKKFKDVVDESNEGDNDDIESFDDSEVGLKKNAAQRILNNVMSICASDLGVFSGCNDVIKYDELVKNGDSDYPKESKKQRTERLRRKMFRAAKVIFNDTFTNLFKDRNLFILNAQTGKMEINPNKNLSLREACILLFACFLPTVITQFVDSLILTTHSKLLTNTCFKFINMLRVYNGTIGSCDIYTYLGGFNIIKNQELMSSLVGAETENPDEIRDKLYNVIKAIFSSYSNSSRLYNFFPIANPYDNTTQVHRIIIDESPCFMEKLLANLSTKLIENTENISDMGQSIHDMIILDNKLKETGSQLPPPNGNPMKRLEHIKLDSFQTIMNEMSSFIRNSIEINKNEKATDEEVNDALEIVKKFFLSAYDVEGAMSMGSYEDKSISPVAAENKICGFKIASSTYRNNFESSHANIASAIRRVHKEAPIPYTMTPESDNKVSFVVSKMGRFGPIEKCSVVKNQLGVMLVDQESKNKIKHNMPFEGTIKYSIPDHENIGEEKVVFEEIYSIPYTYFAAMIIFSIIYPAKIANDVNSSGEGTLKKIEWNQIKPHKERSKEKNRDYSYDSRDTILSQADRYKENNTSSYIEKSARHFFQDISKQNSNRVVGLYQAHLSPLILNDFNINIDTKETSSDMEIIINLILESNIKILSPAFAIWIMSKMPLSQLVLLSATTGFDGIYGNEIIGDYRNFQNELKLSKENDNDNLYRDGLYTLPPKESSKIKSDFDSMKLRNADTNEPCPVSLNSMCVGTNGNGMSKEELFDLDRTIQKKITVKELPGYIDGEPDFFNKEYHQNANKISKTQEIHFGESAEKIKAGLLFSKNIVQDKKNIDKCWELTQITDGVITFNNIFEILSKKKADLKDHWKPLFNSIMDITTNSGTRYMHPHRHKEFLNECAALIDSVLKRKHQYIASRSDRASKIIVAYAQGIFGDLDERKGEGTGCDKLKNKLKTLPDGSFNKKIIGDLIEFYEMNHDWYKNNKSIASDVVKLSIVLPPRMIANLTDSELSEFKKEYPNGVLLVHFVASKCKNSDTQIELFRGAEKKKFLVNTLSSFNNSQGFNLQVRFYCSVTRTYIEEDYGIMSFISDQHYSNVGEFLSERSRMFHVAQVRDKKEEVSKVIMVSDIMMRASYANKLKWSAIKGGDQVEVLERRLYREHIADKLKKIMQTYGRGERSDRTKPLDINFYSYGNSKQDNLYNEVSISFLFFINDEIGFSSESKYLESDIVPFASTLTTVLITAFIHDNYNEINEYIEHGDENPSNINRKNCDAASDRLWGGKKNTFSELMNAGREIVENEPEEKVNMKKNILRLAYEIRSVLPPIAGSSKNNSYSLLEAMFEDSIRRINRLVAEVPELHGICEDYQIIQDLETIRDNSMALNLSTKNIFDSVNGDKEHVLSSIPVFKDTVILTNSINVEIDNMIKEMRIKDENGNVDIKLTKSALNLLESYKKSLDKMSIFYMDDYLKNYIKGNIGEHLFDEIISNSNIDTTLWFKIENQKNEHNIWTGDYVIKKMNGTPVKDKDEKDVIIDGALVRGAYERADVLFYSPYKHKILAFDVKNYSLPWENLIPSDQKIEDKKEAIRNAFSPELCEFRELIVGSEEPTPEKAEIELKVVNINPNKANRNYQNNNLISMWSSASIRDKEDFREMIAMNNEIRLSFS